MLTAREAQAETQKKEKQWEEIDKEVSEHLSNIETHIKAAIIDRKYYILYEVCDKDLVSSKQVVLFDIEGSLRKLGYGVRQRTGTSIGTTTNLKCSGPGENYFVEVINLEISWLRS